MTSLEIKVGDTVFKNLIWVASGTFGNASEFKNFVELNDVGAIITKTITLNPRAGNPPPRIVETPSGLLNSVGLENKGVDCFIKETYPFLKTLKTNVIISIAGKSEEEFISCIEKLSEDDFPSAFELNLSCPNVSHGAQKYPLISQDPKVTERFVSAIRQKTKKPIIVKLTPNVTSIAEIAVAAEAAGADAVSLVNTYFGMAVDAKSAKAILGNIIGGVSGPAIKPLALKAVWDVYHAVKIPIIGIGGIMSGIDVAEFMLCGASAVQIGTANLIDPAASTRILKEFEDYLKTQNIQHLDQLIGKLNANIST